MGLAKQLVVADQTVKSGGWQAAWSQPLRGKTLAIAGLGKLGAQVARFANAFNMSVIAWSENLTSERAEAHGARKVDKDTLFKEADYLLVHLVLSDRTRGLIGAQELAQMKSSAYLINTSRGPIVDERALIDTLKNKCIAGAGIDVFDVEPLPLDHPFRKMDNVLLTGHTGYLVRDGIANAYVESVENIQHWLSGKPIRVLNA
jgi:phosphoglycerate dehydrogenase-like enzyme